MARSGVMHKSPRDRVAHAVFRICCAVGVAGGALWAWTNRAHAAHVQAVWQPWFLAIGAGLLAGAIIGAVLAHLFRS